MREFERENAAYNVLKKVLYEGAYSSVELDRVLSLTDEVNRGAVTALVYGVLDKNVALDYVIGKLAAKGKVKNNIAVILKMGLYEIIFGNTPQYAATDRYVRFARERVNGAQGFVNAILRAAKTAVFPCGDDAASLSVRFSRPEWAIKRMINDFGVEKTVENLSSVFDGRTHIRRNSRTVSVEEFDKEIEHSDEKHNYSATSKGYYVTRNTLKNLNPTHFTAQSLSSIYAAEAYAEGLSGKIRILDLCAAPGGKSVYLSELLPEADITACDIHEHRVRLIEAYASRMKSRIKALKNDATVKRNDWYETFDLVVCDVPCTGSGLICSSPDILLGKKDSDVFALAELQYNILSVAADYVKPGGRLAYSTCSLFTAEDERVTEKFLQSDSRFEAYGNAIRFFPNEGLDGFYILRMKRK